MQGASKPSVFELEASGHLNGLLAPTLRYLLTLLTRRHPRHLLRLLNRFDELYALLSLLVERHYLEAFGAGFVENFYGLKRERVVRVKGGEVERTARAVPAEVRRLVALSGDGHGGGVWRNLAVMVGLPYLKRKLDDGFEVHVAAENTLVDVAGSRRHVDRFAMPAHPTVGQRALWCYRWFLRTVYPTVNAGYHLASLAFSLAYLFDGTKYSTPFLWLVRTRMSRLDVEDHRAFALAAETDTVGGDDGDGLGWRGVLDRRFLHARVLSGLKILLPASIFALKFLEWWHASDFSRQLSRKAAEGLELPPPIVTGMERGRSRPRRQGQEETQPTEKKTPASRRSLPRSPISLAAKLPILTVPAPPTTDLCPICLHPITNPTACQTGYVYDYKCIFQWIEGTHQRQTAWMAGQSTGEGGAGGGGSEWGDADEEEDDDEEEEEEEAEVMEGVSGGNGNGKRKGRDGRGTREGQWESGAGRCAITGRRVLGGSNGLRRLMV